MYKLTVYIPHDHVDVVKSALFAAGAGQMGHYTHCAWQVLGQGQFLPLPSSEPYLGRQGEVATVLEYRVEMVCAKAVIKPVIAALHTAHPYEVPAYDLIALDVAAKF